MLNEKQDTNQGNLERAIELAEQIIKSDALFEVDKRIGMEVLKLVMRKNPEPEAIRMYIDFFENKSNIPPTANYFRDYEQGRKLFQDMYTALDELYKGL